VGRWRVREDVRTEEERLNPGRAEVWNFSKLRNEVRGADERGRCSVIVAASRNQCNRASVTRAISISVDARV
jgi:hypothetical protein